MGGLTRLRAGLLRRSARLAPAGRRTWMEALWAGVAAGRLSRMAGHLSPAMAIWAARPGRGAAPRWLAGGGL